VLLSLAATARAQAPLAPETPLTLRPSAGLAPLTGAVARALSTRMNVEVTVGDAPPPQVIEAIPSGHLALAHAEGRMLLVLAGPEGQVFRSEVALRSLRDRGAARAVALAIEALRDAALEGPPEGTASQRSYRHAGHEIAWTYREREGGLFGPRRRVESDAKPLIQLGLLGGLSAERLSFYFGPRIGLGLCLIDTCIILEGDVPILPEVRTSCDGRRLEYRAVALGLRLLVRPFNVDDVVFGALSVGILTRFGIANLVGVDASRLTTDFGIRAAGEISWRFAPPLELALEIGGDIHVSPARFVRTTRAPPGVPCPPVETVLVEDVGNVFAALLVRLRP
jgi:hypothetical protein